MTQAIQDLEAAGVNRRDYFNNEVGFVITRFTDSAGTDRIKIGTSVFGTEKFKRGVEVASDYKDPNGKELKVVPYLTFDENGVVVDKSRIYNLSPKIYETLVKVIAETPSEPKA